MFVRRNGLHEADRHDASFSSRLFDVATEAPATA
jgi:hypothetical protein